MARSEVTDEILDRIESSGLDVELTLVLRSPRGAPRWIVDARSKSDEVWRVVGRNRHEIVTTLADQVGIGL